MVPLYIFPVLLLISSASSSPSLLNKVKNDITVVREPVESVAVGAVFKHCEGLKQIAGVGHDQVAGTEKEPDCASLTLEFRTQTSKTIYNITSISTELPESKDFKFEKKIALFIHGFIDNPRGSSFAAIADSFLKNGQYNTLALDGSPLIKWLYLRSSTYVRFMGEKVGETLAALVKKGQSPDDILLVGHSLGSHIAGFAGKKFQELTGKKIGRIASLDPAGPCFSELEAGLRINKDDAKYVDVTHSNAGVFGLDQNIEGQSPDDILLVGHSLGSHIAGFAGKKFQELTGKKIGRIASLDPAGPCFSELEAGLRINKDDAKYVDVTHSNAGVFGLDQNIGHADYWPNGGRSQPSCATATCSHNLVNEFFAESIVNPKAFPAKKCKDWDTFKDNKCVDSTEVAYMGLPSESQGVFYLRTADKQPYGLETRGLTYDKSEDALGVKAVDVVKKPLGLISSPFKKVF